MTTTMPEEFGGPARITGAGEMAAVRAKQRREWREAVEARWR
ncbi:MAG: hypothetical protein ACK5ZJ_08235 [Acidobacteriota bacterium]